MFLSFLRIISAKSSPEMLDFKSISKNTTLTLLTFTNSVNSSGFVVLNAIRALTLHSINNDSSIFSNFVKALKLSSHNTKSNIYFSSV